MSEYPFRSLGEMLEKRAEELKDKTALYYYDDTYTYTQLNEKATRFANALRKLGFKKGDILGVFLYNSPETLISFFGAHKIGVAASPVNTEWKEEEVHHQLSHSEAKGVIVHEDFLPVVENIKHRLPNLKHIIIVEKIPAGRGLDYTTLMNEASPHRDWELSADLEDMAFLFYTAGTTGKPKGVPLLHRNIISYYKAREGGIVGGGMAFGASLNLVFLVILPLYHVNAMMTSMACINNGFTICLRKKFSAREFWAVVERYKVNVMSAVPAVYNILLKDEENYKKYDRSSFVLAITGAAEISPETIKRFEEKFGVMVYEGYGLTEGTVASTMNPFGERKIGSIGKPIPGQEVAIMDEKGNLLGPRQIGEIVIRGENVMKGYYKDEKATRETIDEQGWLHTGDMGYYDEDNYFYIVGRKKDMIIRGGENIFPKEIEDFIQEHPKVLEAAVVGVPDPIMGEEAKAYVRKKDPSLTEEELRKYLESKLAKHKVPRYISFVEDFPRNPMGKVLKRELRELAKKEHPVNK